MWLIVGLGNPGKKYLMNRHNVGFMAVDVLRDKWGADPEKEKFDGIYSTASVAGDKIILLKPQTFMNNSGAAVQKAAQFFKIKPDHILVIHDEIALDAGRLKMKQGGGHAGHNGLRSVDQHIGANYHRLRVGVGHPGPKDMVDKHVLANFSKDDQDWLAEFLADMNNILTDYMANLA